MLEKVKHSWTQLIVVICELPSQMSPYEAMDCQQLSPRSAFVQGRTSSPNPFSNRETLRSKVNHFLDTLPPRMIQQKRRTNCVKVSRTMQNFCRMNMYHYKIEFFGKNEFRSRLSSNHYNQTCLQLNPVSNKIAVCGLQVGKLL